MKVLQYDSLSELINSSGLYLYSVIDVSSIKTALSEGRVHLEDWQRSGYAAGMSYMNRPPELFCELENFLPGIKSIIMCAAPYALPKVQDPECPKGYGMVARYARGRDYHQVLRDMLSECLSRVRSHNADIGINGRVFTDAVPLLERALAAGAGLGFIGKSAMNIIPGIGTYFFLGEILLDCEIRGIPEKPVDKASCGTCMNCIAKCPTNAFVGPKVLDAGKCISYLTIEKRGVHSDKEAAMIGDWIFGCDVCQEVCPFNRHGKEVVPWEYFRPEYGAGALLNIPELLAIRENRVFSARFSHTPLMRAKREGLIRNGLCVLYNQNGTEWHEDIISCYLDDSSLIIREQAKWVLHEFLETETGQAAIRIKRALKEGERPCID